MQRGHAVDAWLPTLARWAMRTERRPASSIRLSMRHAAVVCGVARADLVQETTVDLVDDLEVPRQQAPKSSTVHFSERLGQQRVVGVGERCARDLPRLVPVEPVDVDQQAHQLRHRHRRVGVVELHRVLVGELARAERPSARWMRIMSCSAQETKKYCCSSCRPLAAAQLVVRVEHLGEVLGGHLLVDGAQ